MTVKSLEFDQIEIIKGIMELNNIPCFDVDVTYGNGQFWKKLPPPLFRFDIDESLKGVTVASSDNLPLPSDKFRSIMFDPPFLTYVRQNRTGNGSMIMANRFSGYWRYDELEEHYRGTIKEAARILTKKGILVIKCQDLIHNHKLHATHINVSDWAKEWFRLKDLYILGAKHRLPKPNKNGVQKHARIYHSYFMVFERL